MMCIELGYLGVRDMKKYVKPMVEVNEDLAEGIYAASGDSGCWTINSVNKESGGGHERYFEVNTTHSMDVQHISNAFVMEFDFNYPISEARTDFEGAVTVSGNTVRIERNYHGNAYKAGDLVVFKVIVQCADQAMLDGVACTGYRVISCDKSVNVQGNGGDE